MTPDRIRTALSGPVWRRKAKGGLASLLRWVFLICVGYVALYPLFVMIVMSVMPQSDMLDKSVVYIPKSLSAEHFQVALERMRFGKALLNTLLYPVAGGLIEVLTCSLTAYGFARFRFREKNFMFALVILTIIIPPTLMMIPQYLIFFDFDPFGLVSLLRLITSAPIQLDLTGTGFVFYLPSLLSVGLRAGVFIFIYRQFFVGLPKELEEAAYVDGSSPLRTFFQVIVPSSSVAFVTVLVLSLVWHWNESYLTGILLHEETFPLAVMLEQFGSLTNISYGARMAACLLFIIPILAVYLLLQRRFIQSIDRVGIVG